MDLLLGTANQGKLIEIQESLSGLSVICKTPADFGLAESPKEEGETYAQNASQKAHFYYEHAKIPTLADDSGILVEALQNELGIHTRRWGAGKDATDAEWIAHFLERINQGENRRARFTCVLAFIDEYGTEHLFEGSCNGVITQQLEADYLPGLPISACFRPDGFEKVYSALSVQEKNSVSHRGRALAKFRTFLEKEFLAAS